MKTFREIAESIQKLNDDIMDKKLKGKDIITFEYNMEAAMELAKNGNVFITKEKEFMNIEKPVSKEIIKKFNLKEV